jgi:uncharacterized protein
MAEELKASREFQVFAKPAGALCNLDCRYCYYLEKRGLYAGREPLRMSNDLLERYIVQHIRASSGPVVTFSWHGGEPTILGLDYFRNIVSLQRRHCPPRYQISNGIQTNGILIDEEWCRFLALERFGVGLSLDGPQEMHDRYRVTRAGRATQKEATRAFRLLRRHGVPVDILCAVHDQNVRHPSRVYRFFRELGASYLGFLPVVKPVPAAPAAVSPQTVPAESYGEFLCTIFDEWRRHDLGRITVQAIEEASRPMRGLEHSLCIFRETCGNIPVIEHNGDFYSCDHFVDETHRLGNIRVTPLVDLLASPEQRAFGDAKRECLPQYCRACDFLPLCNGGCPKDRFLRTPDGQNGLNYLCAGFRKFFAHAFPHLAMLNAPRIMPPGTAPTLKSAGPGRNDPCTCGSGRKYKKCCLNTES